MAPIGQIKGSLLRIAPMVSKRPNWLVLLPRIVMIKG